MTTHSQPQRNSISSIDPKIVSALLDAARSSRLRTDEFMASRYPKTRITDSFWKSYFEKFDTQ